jgi:hypothetical protein
MDGRRCGTQDPWHEAVNERTRQRHVAAAHRLFLAGDRIGSRAVLATPLRACRLNPRKRKCRVPSPPHANSFCPLVAVSWQRPNIGSPCDSRGSCTVLGAPGGETPLGDSTDSALPAALPARAVAPSRRAAALCPDVGLTVLCMTERAPPRSSSHSDLGLVLVALTALLSCRGRWRAGTGRREPCDAPHRQRMTLLQPRAER